MRGVLVCLKHRWRAVRFTATALDRARKKTEAHEAKIAVQALEHLRRGEPLKRYCGSRKCRAVFVVEAGQLSWFFERGLKLPRWCDSCRKARKEARRGAAA